MSVADREGDWFKLNQDIIVQLEQTSQLATQTQIRELLIGLALEIATMTDDELVFYPLAYLVKQTPVPLVDGLLAQQTLQQYTVPYKINYFAKGVGDKPLTLDMALMFNEMGANGHYDTTSEDNLEYMPEFSQALKILLIHSTLTSDDIVNFINLLTRAGQYRFSYQDLSTVVIRRIDDWLNSIYSVKSMTNFKQKSLIIFDWDGTLMDSVGLIVDAMRHAAEQNGLTVTDEATKSIIGIALVDAFPILFPNDSDKYDALLASYSQYYVQHCDNDKLFDGITALIERLHNQGKVLAIATGKKRQGLQRVLPNSGIEPFFTVTKTADETAGKPNPLMLEQILLETGKTVEDAMMIGDSIHDIRMANNINMESIAVSYGCERAEILATENPSVIVDSIANLQKLLV